MLGCLQMAQPTSSVRCHGSRTYNDDKYYDTDGESNNQWNQVWISLRGRLSKWILNIYNKKMQRICLKYITDEQLRKEKYASAS